MRHNNGIMLTESNREAVEEILQDANGKATAHTVQTLAEVKSLSVIAEDKLKASELPAKERIGVLARVIRYTGVPNSYRYKVRTTEVDLIRRASGWAIQTARPVRVGAKHSGTVTLGLTQSQAEEIARRALAKYVTQERYPNWEWAVEVSSKALGS